MNNLPEKSLRFHANLIPIAFWFLFCFHLHRYIVTNFAPHENQYNIIDFFKAFANYYRNYFTYW